MQSLWLHPDTESESERLGWAQQSEYQLTLQGVLMLEFENLRCSLARTL